jgi:radical SAM/Cys-rich protein
MPAMSLASRRLPLAQPRVQLAHIDGVALDHEFETLLEQHGLWPLTPVRISTLQINLGEMFRLYGVSFDSLHCMTNMPIARYLEWLLQSGNLDSYLQRLAGAFNPAAAAAVMCRTTLSVGWDGRLYDCDFNQMLDLGVEPKAPPHIDAFERAALEARRIVVRRHCFGCTAGAGSSCAGATA